jgi:mevalonate kinase
VIEYQREAEQVIECAGEMVNRIEKLLSSGQKDAATREELKVLIRQAQKAFKEAKHKDRKANQILSKTNKMIRRLSDFWSPNETLELDQFIPTWNTL